MGGSAFSKALVKMSGLRHGRRALSFGMVAGMSAKQFKRCGTPILPPRFKVHRRPFQVGRRGRSAIAVLEEIGIRKCVCVIRVARYPRH